MITFTNEFLRDKIYACWLGKNIGGTLGTPYEGQRDMHDIQGFASKPGEPLPNDDLDLQLVWLRAVTEWGPDAINSKLLGEYWLTYIGPNWNEYGVCKANMRNGIQPPMTGEIDNEQWQDSNGAWIRTEVWACMYPAMPEKAIRLAFEDASVDHGFGEGTYAAIFVAAMESAAFVINDAEELLKIGLSKIPENCRVARSARIVIDAYHNGVDWRTCRNMVVEDSKDLGWFQAPANVAFVVLGLLYGKGDFKQSLIYAVDCGDDTDCTGATLGSLMGIMGGMKVIPDDWRAYIGDDIKSICIAAGHGLWPKTCTELTDCIMDVLPITLNRRHGLLGNINKSVQLGSELCIGDVNPESFYGREFVEKLAARKRYSFVVESPLADVLVEFDEKPVVQPGGTLTGAISIERHTFNEQRHYLLRFITPEGWSVEHQRNLFAPSLSSEDFRHASTKFTIHVGENVEANNSIIGEITCPGHHTKIFLPIQILG